MTDEKLGYIYLGMDMIMQVGEDGEIMMLVDMRLLFRNGMLEKV